MVLLLRKTKVYRNLALTSLALLLLLVATSPLAIADLPAQKRWLGVLVFFGVFGTIFGVVPLLLLLDYHRSRLAINGDRLAWQGIWRRGFLHFSDVEQLTWRWVKNFRTIVLKSANQRLKISLDEYERETWLPLIRHLRNSIPEDQQRDWDWFCLKTALPLRRTESELTDDQPDAATAADKADFTITRGRWDSFFLAAAVILAPVVVAWWWFMNDARVFGVFPALVPLWLYLRIRTPARGIRTKRLSQDAPQRRFIAWSMLLMMPMSALCNLAHRHIATAILYWTLMAGWLAAAYLVLRRAEKRRVADDAEAVKSAALEWELGEKLCEQEPAAS